MYKEFYNLEEMQEYYDENSNTYIFKEDDEYIDWVIFNFDLNIEANIRTRDIFAPSITAWNIDAWNIDAWNIEAYDIRALDIDADNIIAGNIKARNIKYYAVCCAYNSIRCRTIKGERRNAKHFVLDGTLEVEEE